MNEFVAWDGEGITIDGEHRYILLACSTGTYIRNDKGISTTEALALFWSEYRKHPRAKHVIFSGSYDANCILRDLPRSQLEAIWNGLSVKYHGVEISYTSRRQFEITKGKRVFTLWDIWGFYQASFVKAMQTNISDFAGLEEIIEQKQRRSEFTLDEFDSILHYCQLELTGLVALMERLDRDLKRSGIGTLRMYHGAGSIAGKILQNQHVKRHRAVLPDSVDKAARFAYAGGRSEVWRMGYHKGAFWTHDINSAYPYAAILLPSLVEGTWEESSYKNSSDFTLIKLRFDARDKPSRGYPFFHRMKNGNILFPPCVEGWFWKPEVTAALNTGFAECITILDCLTYREGTEYRPFSFVPEYFKKREALKLAGEMGAQKVLKLGLNSLYGKLAQSVGGTLNNPPAFHQIAWAGYITALTRASVFEAAMQRPDDVAFIATDGIGTTTALNLPTGSGLGEWEKTEYTSALIVQAGVYFLWQDKELIEHYRGFDKDSITPEVILNGWRKREPEIGIPSTRFITLGSALHSERAWNEWRQWRTIQRAISLTGGGGKRQLSGYPDLYKQFFPLYSFDWAPHNGGKIPTNFAYPRKWLGESWKDLEYTDGVLTSIYDSEPGVDTEYQEV